MEYRLLLKPGNGRRRNRIDSESKAIQAFLATESKHRPREVRECGWL